ncbi:polyketide synthase [Aspergillus eucalypticola CBS 122712]|uniref:Polyketide synthase n=1 Tax=Aspergillus eucalypticola (strain CBS 122712 / IBT 29274) TaxID=1448314 RepID=A0A317UMW7_ASPEC|nr:polyketide synthase [Aspergillus eucalypticola CBS 122712]PWY61907.1 polyketide synthase [Aspergillus eucalypticola CBS 122712]
MAEPIAIVGMACRLPGENFSPSQFWEFLKRGGLASSEVPESRFSIDAHYDETRKSHSMRTPGGKFLEKVDLRDFDAGFFNISPGEATAMDPQQRLLLEVVYESLENSGIPLSAVNGAQVGCFVGSFLSDYDYIHARDPDNRPNFILTGIGRAILSNRISHVLNLKGPSMTIDTGCSGSLVGVDVACRYLSAGDVDSAIVAACNLFFSPEHTTDPSSTGAIYTGTGQCHTFDAKADGYAKAEGVGSVVLKRLSDAIRDRDPIRGVIRGWAVNSDGQTAGISTPDAVAQAACIRAAYEKAGIEDRSLTPYVEFHGTGTKASDLTEVEGINLAFEPAQNRDKPLMISSVKSNIGHGEAVAGLNGLLKAILTVENGLIPGNPTFMEPSPLIDFDKLNLHVSNRATPWPQNALRRASVNSFGYGGTNCHIVLDGANMWMDPSGPFHKSSYNSKMGGIMLEDDDDDEQEIEFKRPFLLVQSASDEYSLKNNCKELTRHFSKINVKAELRDVAYTLSERRSHHLHRAFAIADRLPINESDFMHGKVDVQVPRICFIFTGQGSQWPQMGKEVIQAFPVAADTIKELDAVLQTIPEAPSWKLWDELTESRDSSHIRQPELSQPLVTALQLALVDLFHSSGISPQGVVGHSSGEIAAAYAAGYVSKADAIKIAFYRGYAAKVHPMKSVGMMAVGLGPDAVRPYIEKHQELVQIACINSPQSVTLSGSTDGLEAVMEPLTADGHFARLLQVDLAYHSRFMAEIGDSYYSLLQSNIASGEAGTNTTTMFSSVTGARMQAIPNARYWQQNMVSPVLFSSAVQQMVNAHQGPNLVIEVGPSATLAGPIKQITESVTQTGISIKYAGLLSRKEGTLPLFRTVGDLYNSGVSIQLDSFNRTRDDEAIRPAVLVDLPNYSWNHTTKYWYETRPSRDWRFRRFRHHDLLGSKILGTSWQSPSWSKILHLREHPWLNDHKIGKDIVFPAAGYVSMAMEALFQAKVATEAIQTQDRQQLQYQIRDLRLTKAMVLDENIPAEIQLTLDSHVSPSSPWSRFKISALKDSIADVNCSGLIRLDQTAPGRAVPRRPTNPRLPGVSPPDLTMGGAQTQGTLWYSSLADVGQDYGPAFQRIQGVKSLPGVRRTVSEVLIRDPSQEKGQSPYPLHPAPMDAILQCILTVVWQGDRSAIPGPVVPVAFDNITIFPMAGSSPTATCLATAGYKGHGRPTDPHSLKSHASLYDSQNGALLASVEGMVVQQLSSTGPDRVDTSAVAPAPAWSLGGPTTDIRIEEVQDVIDLILHKTPFLNVVEINLTRASTSLWLGGAQLKQNRNFRDYRFLLADPDAANEAREQLADRGVRIGYLDPASPKLGTVSGEIDLLIVHYQTDTQLQALQSLIPEALKLLAPATGTVLPVRKLTPHALTNGTTPTKPSEVIDQLLQADSYIKVLTAEDPTGYAALWRGPNLTPIPVEKRTVAIARFRADALPFGSLAKALGRYNYDFQEHFYPFTKIPSDAMVLVVDEIQSPMFAEATSKIWNGFKILLEKHCRMVWVTRGAMIQVSNPNNAVSHGVIRTARLEDPSQAIITLDIEGDVASATGCASIAQMLFHVEHLERGKAADSDFAEHGGLLHISRLEKQSAVAGFHEPLGSSQPLTELKMHESNSIVRLQTGTAGSVESLRYVQLPSDQSELPEDKVEVELYASGLNFKDIAISMDLVDEDEHMLGSEGAGIVRRVGRHVSGFRCGDRVAVITQGCLANRIQACPANVIRIPDSMSMEAAASIPVAYCTAVLSLFHLASLKKAQSVLIHSATGGVGYACIQLAKYVGAEVFATAGSDEKRDYLHKTHGIPKSHIFSSRDSSFSSGIMNVTNGKGVDVVVNTLMGEMLEHSWRICARNGVLVELGKADIRSRGYLSLEPFDRGCSFRALDLTLVLGEPERISRVLREVFQLIEAGHVPPVEERTAHAYDKIKDVFAQMRSARHLGKLILSNGEGQDYSVPVQTTLQQPAIRTNASYLIVGGLRGVCGRFAISLAQWGARNLVVMSRSGLGDDKSQTIIEACRRLGCAIEDIRGNVLSPTDVGHVFDTARLPIAGVIQGVMSLNDKPLETMTLEEFQGTLSGKVHGTWNIHNAAIERGLSLDFFSMLSSILSVLGHAGQANYVAGNLFLDAFAMYRHCKGFPAHSINLSAVEDIGYIAENQGNWQRHLPLNDITLIREKHLECILRDSLLQQMDPSQKRPGLTQLVVGVREQISPDSQYARDNRFLPLIAHGDGGDLAAGQSGSSGELANFIDVANSASDRATVVSHAVQLFNVQLTKFLHLAEPMEPAKPLGAYGLDSLTALEFRNWLRDTLTVEMSTLDIAGAGSLYALSERFVSKFLVPSEK